MPVTYDPIATQTLTTATATVTFSSIPQTYTDLVLVAQMRLTNGTQPVMMRFNGDSGTNYSITRIYGSGSSSPSDRYPNQDGIDCAYVSNSNWNIVNHSIQSYSNTTTFKTMLGRWNDSAYTFAQVGLWRNTSAITTISLTPIAGDTHISGSTFTLYGIKAA